MRAKKEVQDPVKKALLLAVGQKIKNFRQGKLTQAQLAFAVGIHPSTITVIENGRENISIYTLFRIAKALEIDLATLFKGI